MKLFLLVLLLSITYNTSAQSSDDNVIGRYGDQYFVVKKDGYYIAEYFGDEQDAVIVRDTLLPVNNYTDTFRGHVFQLFLVQDKFLLGRLDKGIGGVTLKTPTAEERKRRIQLYNYYYYLPYEANMTQYAGSSSHGDKKRGGIYIQIREMDIEEFRHYFDAFLKEHNITRP